MVFDNNTPFDDSTFWSFGQLISMAKFDASYRQRNFWSKGIVFSVNLVCKKELNLMLKVSEISSQGTVGFELRGNDYFLPRLYDLINK